MNRFSMQPIIYASIDDLRRALLIQVRRFNKACSELAADDDENTISLTGGGGRRLSSKKITPEMKQGDADLQRLDLLYAQIRLLSSMSGQLLTQFGTDKQALTLRKQVEALKTTIRKKMVELQRQVSDEASGKINSIVKRRAGDLVRELTADLKLKPTQLSVQYFTGTIKAPGSGEANIFAEAFYVRLRNLTDPEGNRQQNFYITVAFPREYIDKGKTPVVKNAKLAEMYLAINEKFTILPKLRWEATPKTPQELKVMVKSFLERNGIIGVSEKRDIPIPKDKITFIHDNIAGHTVKGNVIEVKVKDINEINATADEIREQLYSIVQAYDPKNRDLVLVKPVKTAAGPVIRLIFSLPAKMKGRVLSTNLLQEIKRVANLSDVEVQRVKTALEDHED